MIADFTNLLYNFDLFINCRNKIIQDNITEKKINLNLTTFLMNLIVNNVSLFLFVNELI